MKHLTTKITEVTGESIASFAHSTWQSQPPRPRGACQAFGNKSGVVFKMSARSTTALCLFTVAANSSNLDKTARGIRTGQVIDAGMHTSRTKAKKAGA
jgi:hypothetical protein